MKIPPFSRQFRIETHQIKVLIKTSIHTHSFQNLIEIYLARGYVNMHTFFTLHIQIFEKNILNKKQHTLY